MDICTSSHPKCSQVDSQPPPLPTRVIAVGTKGSSKSYLVSGDKKRGYYATLSHCWGGPNNRPLSSTDQTLSCRQQGIEDESLPKTFRHAVHVCRELGIEYIWIDSLCIIQAQETQEDWAKEAPKMGVVYGNSILNISAAAAADSTQGCFKERLGLFCWPCPITLFGQACYLFRHPTGVELICADPGDLDISKNVLAQRAWVLQEQVLSRRSITFSKTLLIWRCRTLSTNEKYPLGIPHAQGILADNYRLLHCLINGVPLPMPKTPMIYFYTCWYRIVTEFTGRDLTYEEDRLSAIAGIAKRFGGVVDDTYHAGLWRRDMITGLLWNPGRTPGKHRTRSARAPSWSWASIGGGVTYQNLLSFSAVRIPFLPLVDILDVFDPPTCVEHPFGVTSKASLSLSGVLIAVVQNEHEDSRPALIDEGTHFEHRGNILISDVGNFDQLDLACLFYLPVGLAVAYDYEQVLQNKGDLHRFFLETSLETEKQDRLAFDHVYCLILEIAQGKQDTYRRVGLCIVGYYQNIEVISPAVLGERRSITLI